MYLFLLQVHRMKSMIQYLVDVGNSLGLLSLKCINASCFLKSALMNVQYQSVLHIKIYL